jgi:hypothetical protein
MALEKAMDNLDLDRIRKMANREWYEFLRDEYFRWKYTAPNRYATTTAQLRKYENNGRMGELDRIRRLLLSINVTDVYSGLEIANNILGLGIAGASGLLALMYPHAFATVDQFIVKALSRLENLPEAAAIARMKPDRIGIEAAILLIEIMRKKARDNNRLFATTIWTPRKIHMVLWGCRS